MTKIISAEQCKANPNKAYRSSSSFTLDELQKAVPEHFKDNVHLRMTVLLTIIGVEAKPVNSLQSSKSSLASSAFLKYALYKNHSGVVVESDGQEFPVHSLALKCKRIHHFSGKFHISAGHSQIFRICICRHEPSAYCNARN